MATPRARRSIDFYPLDFQSDLNGKKADWEALVLIPFIDQGRLLDALATRQSFLTPEERERNRHSLPLMCRRTDGVVNMYKSSLPGIWPDLENRATCEEMSFPHTKATDNHVVGLAADYSPDVYFPGFPTFRHVGHHSELRDLSIKVFNFPSKNPSRVVAVDAATVPASAAGEGGKGILGTICLVRYPHLVEARVEKVSSAEGHWSLQKQAGEPPVKVWTKHSASETASWHKSASDLQKTLLTTRAIDSGKVKVVLSCCLARGTKVQMDKSGVFRKERLWNPAVSHYALQTVVTDASCVWKDPQNADVITLKERFPIGTEVVFTGQPGYGSLGCVTGVDQSKKRVSVQIKQQKFPDLRKGINAPKPKYLPSYQLSKTVGISGLLVARLTSSVFVLDGSARQPGKGKTIFGLRLKNSKQGLEMPG